MKILSFRGGKDNVFRLRRLFDHILSYFNERGESFKVLEKHFAKYMLSSSKGLKILAQNKLSAAKRVN